MPFEQGKGQLAGAKFRLELVGRRSCVIIMKVGMNGMQLLERSEGNTVVSPLSLFTSLSMASLGAKGLTLDEIHRTLHLSPEALSRMGGIIASFQVFESAAIQFAIIQPNHQMFPTLRYTPINKKLFFLIASFHPSQPPNHPTTQPPTSQTTTKSHKNLECSWRHPRQMAD